VKGFGWKNMNVISVGLQYKGIEKLPLRVGYTYSSNPIDSELAFFSIPATAIIENAVQFGTSYPLSDNFNLNGVFHYGTSGGKTEGEMLNPMLASASNPYGAVSGTKVGYEMTTSMVMLGLTYTFSK
jgi:long-chain fatty acid transport protein